MIPVYLLYLIGILLLLVIVISIILVYERKISRLRIAFEKGRAKSTEDAQELAKNLFSQWSQNSLKRLEEQITESIRKDYEAQLRDWKSKNEEEIRKDAIQKSINTLLGKIGEEFSPVLLSARYGINLKDFRHLGSPIDFVAFKGLSEESQDIEVLFLEIKSGKTNSLAGRERRVRDAVARKRVSYEVVNINELIGNIKQGLEESR